MSLPNSLHSYTSEIEALDRARNAERGIRIEFPSRSRAVHYRSRLHYARSLDRRENTTAVPQSSPLYGKSDFDCISISLQDDTDGKWWLYLEKNETIPGHVEEL